MSEPKTREAVVDVDPLKDLYNDILSQRQRLRRLPATAENAMAQLDGTALSCLADLTLFVVQLRDGVESQLDEHDERLDGVEALAFREDLGGTRLESEDADRFAALVDTVRQLTAVIRGAGTQTAEVLQSLKLAEDHATECETLIAESRLEEDDEDEEEGDGDEDENESEEEPASPGAEA